MRCCDTHIIVTLAYSLTITMEASSCLKLKLEWFHHYHHHYSCSKISYSNLRVVLLIFNLSSISNCSYIGRFAYCLNHFETIDFSSNYSTMPSLLGFGMVIVTFAKDNFPSRSPINFYYLPFSLVLSII
jgi:hypothetical protein